MTNAKRARRNADIKTPAAQSETTRKIQPGKRLNINPDSGLIDLTLFDDTGKLVENLAIPPALYAQLQPYIRAARAETPPKTVDELEASGGIRFGPLNAPPDGSNSTTFQLSPRMMDRIDKLKSGGARYSEQFTKIFRDGLSLAESGAHVNPFAVIDKSDNVAVELSVFAELGIMLLNTRLHKALEENLSALRRSLSDDGLKTA
jgi:hypothetical protein